MPRYRYYVELAGSEPVTVHHTRTAASVVRVVAANPGNSPALVVFQGSDGKKLAAVAVPAGDTRAVDVGSPAAAGDIQAVRAAGDGTVHAVVVVEDGQ